MKKFLSCIIVAALTLSLLPIAFSANNTAVKASSLYGTDTQTPVIIETVYPRADTLVADYILTSTQYPADYTGKVDCSDILQKAVDDCYSNGGGTVFLPVGKYLVSKTIKVMPNVTIAGDWQNPDEGSDFGTVILAAVSQESSLFALEASSGINGLTVYYINQNIEVPIPYAPTVFLNPGMLFTVQNCTFVNSYVGIYTNWHEMLTVDTLFGTFLSCAIDAKNQSDVGTFKNISVSGKYYSQYDSSVNRTLLDQYTRAHATGLRLADLEWAEFLNVSISDCDTGVVTVKGERVDFCGQFYNLRVFNSRVAFDAQCYDTGNWGIEIGNSYLQGSEASVKNNLSGPIKLAGTVCDGEIASNPPYVIYKKTETIQNIPLEYNKSAKKPEAFLYNLASYGVDKKNGADISAALQKALDDAKKTGGIVYIPAGNYRLENSVTVPSNVEIRGSGASPRRFEDGGTNILIYYGKDLDPFSSLAAINLAGDGAGIKQCGLIYPKNYPVADETAPGGQSHDVYAFAIKATANDNYIENCAIAAACNAILLNGADNHFVKKVISTSYEHTFYVENCNSGYIEGCLQNGTLATRISPRVKNADKTLATFSGNEFSFNQPTAYTLQHIILKNTSKQQIINTFTFGSARFFAATASSSTLINVGADYFIGGRMLSSLENSDTLVVNLMRVTAEGHGYYYDNTGALQIYNQMKAGSQTERDTVLLNNVKKGDLDSNGTISLADAMKTFMYLAGKFARKPDARFLEAADYNDDGDVMIDDAMKIFYILGGKAL